MFRSWLRQLIRMIDTHIKIMLRPWFQFLFKKGVPMVNPWVDLAAAVIYLLAVCIERFF
ncbi:protein of unknown function [Magnetospirillum gryphiswaldense MSR-1 v2]|uniref:Uncharacterized protein n=1 Tax=Magnetospirillum gryphiswaldense (strain DSM 6361 / JCM 21280 / NBRC 15271 / MSR-1) TaxID=431944 RepID=V6F0V2_MAGGM|nr:protein of unknown function [Magnetospirillum gryphiswaldense MSR-1 v2]